MLSSVWTWISEILFQNELFYLFDHFKKQMHQFVPGAETVWLGELCRSITTVCVCLVNQGATAIYWTVLVLHETRQA